jgi:hypothetical protein
MSIFNEMGDIHIVDEDYEVLISFIWGRLGVVDIIRETPEDKKRGIGWETVIDVGDVFYDEEEIRSFI